MIATLISTNADWYLMRASGFVAMALLTITICLGISNLARLATRSWTRTLAALVHRNVSLLAVVFLAIHVLTAISDKYVRIPALSILVPGLSGYDPLWVGLGAVSVDVFIAVVVTSLVRGRLSPRVWRAVHWLAYLSWPSAFVHSVGSGTGAGADTGKAWSTLIYLSCGLLFAAAVAARIRLAGRSPKMVEPPPRYPMPAPMNTPVTPVRPVRPLAGATRSQ